MTRESQIRPGDLVRKALRYRIDPLQNVYLYKSISLIGLPDGRIDSSRMNMLSEPHLLTGLVIDYDERRNFVQILSTGGHLGWIHDSYLEVCTKRSAKNDGGK